MSASASLPAAVAFHDRRVRTADGGLQDLSAYRGHVLLIVNVASACGFTPQYAGLERLYRHYREQGLVVLGFPCDQFGGQEPAADAEIQAFCRQRYDVTFPVFAKIEVNGERADPLFQWLTARAPGLLGTRRIKWNFTKFLVDRAGQVLGRYAPRTRPEALARPLERALRLP